MHSISTSCIIIVGSVIKNRASHWCEAIMYALSDNLWWGLHSPLASSNLNWAFNPSLPFPSCKSLLISTRNREAPFPILGLALPTLLYWLPSWIEERCQIFLSFSKINQIAASMRREEVSWKKEVSQGRYSQLIAKLFFGWDWYLSLSFSLIWLSQLL